MDVSMCVFPGYYTTDTLSCSTLHIKADNTANPLPPGGGMPTSRNRTNWPLKGGAVSIQPGWFPGHASALFYFNMGFGNEPLNFSHSMLPVFQITGPSNQQYDGTFCLPQVPLPPGYTPQVGDNATIQVIELAQHGAALYNVRAHHIHPLFINSSIHPPCNIGNELV